MSGAAAAAGQCSCAEQPAETCHVSKVAVREDHGGAVGLALADVAQTYGSGLLTEVQREEVKMRPVAETSFMCLDDRIDEPSLVTPGGDVGEFILALASYLQERGPGRPGQAQFTQAEVDAVFEQYLEALPPSRPMVHCTDDGALRHLQDELPAEDLDLRRPPDHAKELGLLEKLTEVNNHGDSHIRLLLDKPQWFQLEAGLVPMVLRSFYTSLWKQYQDPSSILYSSPKLRLVVLSGHRDPKGFFEVSSGGFCHKAGMAPMLTPRKNGRSVLLSHLDAVSLRREEHATFFSKIANLTPRKVDVERLHQRLDRHGWSALETTGSQMASGLSFYTLMYS